MSVFRLDNILSTCEKIWYFFKVNILFLIFNLPLLLFLLFVGISQVRTYLPFFMLCSIPFIPAMSAVFFCMNRILHKYDTGAFKDFITGYLYCIKEKFIVSSIYLFIVLIFWTNIEFFAIYFFPLLILFGLLFLLMLLSMPNICLLTSRYKMSVIDILKGAIMLTITKPLITLSNFVIFTFVLMLFEIKAGTFILFISSIYGFLIIFMNQNIFKSLDAKASEQESF